MIFAKTAVCCSMIYFVVNYVWFPVNPMGMGMGVWGVRHVKNWLYAEVAKSYIGTLSLI